jgi:hypothetical protein
VVADSALPGLCGSDGRSESESQSQGRDLRRQDILVEWRKAVASHVVLSAKSLKMSVTVKTSSALSFINGFLAEKFATTGRVRAPAVVCVTL